MSVTIVSKRIYAEPGFLPQEGYITVEGGLISRLGRGKPETGGFLLDVGDLRVVPGFIDLHVHGAVGHDVSSNGGLCALSQYLGENGTTSFQATLGAAPLPVLERVIQEVRDAKLQGADLLGLHLEGPFLNPLKKGAIPGDCLLAPSLELARRWVDLSGGTLTQMTLAPELPGALSVVKYLRSRGVTPSAGHTGASFEQMQQGFQAGIKTVTHTFNAMEGFHHRNPGALGAALVSPKVFCEVIADGVHVHPGAIRLLIKTKRPDRVYVVSDGAPPTGMPPGRYKFMGQTVYLDDEKGCTLEDGTLAGSVIPLRAALGKLVELVKIPFEAALPFVTTNPAKVAGVDDRKGSLHPGKDGDLVVLDDDYGVVWSMARGRVLKAR